MNRVGDVGLALAIFLLWTHLGTVQYSEVFARVGQLSPGVLLAVCVLLLLGACGSPAIRLESKYRTGSK